jgi:hypothetical protein
MATKLKVFFVNEKTNKEYEVIWLNKETGQIRLKGPTREFTDDYSKERFEGLGYKLVKREVEEEDAA